MSACRDAQVSIRENVLIPVMQALTTLQRTCREYRELARREVSQPMEQWVEEAQQVCNDWPWPFSWFCSIVVMVVRVVVWVVEVIVEWVVSIICEVVAVVVQIIVRAIAAVVEFLVSFFVCLFTDFTGWLNSFYELYTAVLDIVESVFDLVGTLLDAVIGILEGLGYLLENVYIAVLSIIPGLGPALGRLLGGFIRNIFRLVRRVLEVVRDLIDHAQDVVFGLLRLDMCRSLSGLMGLATDIGQVVILVFNVFLSWTGGIRDSFEAGSIGRPEDKDNLTRIIDERLESVFAGDSQGLKAARTRIRLHSRPLGLPILLRPYRFYAGSRSPAVDLRALHRDGVLNLYTAIGGPNGCEGRTVLDAPHWEVVYAGTELPVARRDIDAFLSDGPLAAPEFRVYGLRHANFGRYLSVARRKGYQIGLEFTWAPISDYQVSFPNELAYVSGSQESILGRFGRVGGGSDNLCEVPVLGIHSYHNAPTLNGITSWFRPPGFPDRSGVSFRERVPEFVYQWVLVHELGHYFGLDHPGHDGLEHIMITLDAREGMTPVTGGTVAEYLALTGEPRFTLDDARNVWDWLAANAGDCIRER
jgi:hypothetical protein